MLGPGGTWPVLSPVLKEATLCPPVSLLLQLARLSVELVLLPRLLLAVLLVSSLEVFTWLPWLAGLTS